MIIKGEADKADLNFGKYLEEHVSRQERTVRILGIVETNIGLYLESIVKHVKNKFKMSCPGSRCNADRAPEHELEMLNHCIWMLQEMKTFLSENRVQKALGWMYFVQSQLWSHGLFTINELRKHNTPMPDVF
jgi:hypothetical protein